MRLDTLGQLFTASLAFYLIYGNVTKNASTIGFTITMAGKYQTTPTVTDSHLLPAGFSEMILWWVRIYNEFEGQPAFLEVT